MTTGRINQVTTFQNHFRGHRLLTGTPGGGGGGHSPLSRRGVRQLLFHIKWTHRGLRTPSPPPRGGTSDLKPADGVTLFPVLTRLKQDPLVPWRDKGHRP
jgi:hypothetical protein